MAVGSNLKSAYTVTLNDYLPSLGIENEFLRKILSIRLLIERIGEKNNNNWWNSKVMDEFGRKSLTEVVPKSKTKSQIILAQKIGKQKENKVIQSHYNSFQDCISLFYLGPFIEHKLLNAINEIEECMQFPELENLDFKADNPDWAENLVDPTSIEYELKEEVIMLGKISQSSLVSEEEMVNVLDNLVVAYGKSTINNLKVPYYVVDND